MALIGMVVLVFILAGIWTSHEVEKRKLWSKWHNVYDHIHIIPKRPGHEEFWDNWLGEAEDFCIFVEATEVKRQAAIVRELLRSCDNKKDVVVFEWIFKDAEHILKSWWEFRAMVAEEIPKITEKRHMDLKRKNPDVYHKYLNQQTEWNILQ